MSFDVVEAKREKLDASIALIGPSGAGKTLSALFIAYGMMKEKYPKLSDQYIWQKIGVADTEHKRAKVYANSEHCGIRIENFKHIDFIAPYSPTRYKEAVKALIVAGVEVVIIDSLSHCWEGEGGLLDLQQQYGGSFSAWSKVKPHIQDFIKTLTQSGVHVIGSMRTKQDYIISTSELGKQQIQKVGLKTIQKDDLEYEFQITFNIDMDHNARVGKDNSSMFDGRMFKINDEVGKKIFQWLELGIDVKAEERKKIAENAKKIRAYHKKNTEIQDQLGAYIADIEKKANSPIEDFPLVLSDRALMLIENKIIDLGGKLK